MSTEVHPSPHPPQQHAPLDPHDTLSAFSACIQQVHEYAAINYSQAHAKLSITDLANDRFNKLEAINNILEQLQQSCSLAQAEKMDCLEQGLKAIKLIHSQGTKKAGKTNLRERETTSIMKVGVQKEMNLVQKLTDLLLQTAIPNDLTPKSLQQLLTLLLEMFFSLRESEEPKGKQKGKKKETPVAPIVIEYCLMSGRKINLPWLILLRVLQRKLTQGDTIQNPISREAVVQSMEKMVKTIKTVLNFIQSFDNSPTVLKNLLSSLCEHVSQMQLPIVPLFLHTFYQQLQGQFKDTYSIHGCIPAQLFLGKAIFCLQNLDILCRLIKNVHQIMLPFIMEKESCMDSFCSYCGLEQNQESICQAIRVKLPNSDNLVMRICSSCCQQLALEPNKTMEIMLFAPLIFSKFWDYKNNPNIEDTRCCLTHLLAYHGYAPPPTKKQANKAKKNVSISIAETIAMNNVEQRASSHLITGLYSAFLFNHSILSLKNVIYQAMNLLLICINSLDEKIKEKTLKVLNQSHVLAFIFNQHQRTPDIYSQQVTSFRQKFLAIILIKLRDLSLNIRVGALELLSSIYSREDIECGLKVEFYQTIYREIAFSNCPDYIAKSINVIDRSLFKLMRFNNHKDLQGFIQILVQTLDFSKQCLAGLQPSHPVKGQICKLIGKLLQVIIELSEKDYDQIEAKSIAGVFNEALRVKTINEDNLRYVYDLLLEETFKGGLIDIQIMKMVPKISIILVENLISPQVEPERDGEWQVIAHNLIQLVHTVFEDILQTKNVVFGQYEHLSSKVRPVFSIKQLRKYFFSTLFFQKLLLRKEIGGKIRQAILIQLISISNFCRLISDRSCTSVFLKAFLKNRQKWRHCMQFSTAQLFDRLQEVSNVLREEIMVCNLDSISSQCQLFINIKFFIHQENALAQEICKYEAFTSSNIGNLISAMRSYREEGPKNEQYASIIKTYSLITRALTILTSLVSNYQKIVSFGHFLHKSEMKSQSKRKSTKAANEEEIAQRKPSCLFQNCYRLVVEVLQVEFTPTNNDQRFQDLFKSQLLLLNNYWQLNPELILTSSHLLKQLITNIESGQIKGLYKLFLSLLPCSDMRILSIINHNFSLSFPTVFQQRALREDEQLLQYCFLILQHMLRSGMTSLCGMNGYVFCGLMHPSETISVIANQIVKEIYSNEASQRMLFANFIESMNFLFRFYFEYNGTKLELPSLQPQQVQTVKMIANITRPNSKCLLVRQKRQLRIKPSFVKKISQIISEKKRLVHDDPLFLIFLLRMVKTQQSFDYSELYEILFAVNRVSFENLSFMEHLKQQLEDYQQWPQENLNKSLRIYLAYREMLSCTAYLSGYQPVKQQLKNYDKLFDSCPLPFITLKEEVPLSSVGSNTPPRQILVAIAEDVEILLDILAGSVECVIDRRPVGRDDDDWSNTNETKPKAKLSKNRLGANKQPNRTKNTHTRVHVSAQRRKTRACTREQQQNTMNSCSLPRSQESIY